MDENEIAESINSLRAQRPYLAPHPSPPAGWRSSRAGEAERQEYNLQLNRYLSRYEEYLRATTEVRNWQARTRSLCLVLENTGGVPADEISILLRFPPGIQIIEESNFKAIPTVPMPPDLPAEDGLQDGPDISLEEIMASVQATSEAPNAVITNIGTSLDRFEVGIVVSRLKHTFTEHLPALNFQFSSVEGAKSFEFTYKMVASNFPRAVEGTLNVKITVTD